jgi:hypothetical protein
MARPKEKLLAMLGEQMGLLRTSLDGFYGGKFAESLRIATIIRVLVHETGMSKPLLKQARPDGLDLQIREQVDEGTPGQEELIRIAVGIRLGPGRTVAPAVDLLSSHYSLSSVGGWWDRTVFTFPSRLGPQVIYTRKRVVLILSNKEGGAHVDPDEDPDYVRLLTDQPVSFACYGVQIETPDLARFLTAQSGVEMLECLKRNFFPDSDVPSKWECGAAPPVAMYLDQISGMLMRVAPAFPRAEIRVTKRE